MNFDHLAPFYRSLEFFTAGGKMQHCRTCLLHHLPPPRRILLAGEGHGRTLQAMANRFPEASILAIDSSRGMLDVARKHAPASARVEFVQADLLEWDGPIGEFDVIVTNFFLDCFPEDTLALVVAKLGQLAAPSGHWLIADFQIAEGRAARLRSRVILAMLFSFFRLTCDLEAKKLSNPDEMLKRAGFSLKTKTTHEWGLLKSEWWVREQG